ncbi:hypothetical protein GCM10027059_44280 [Myceligenerans halotolerans]
MAIASFKEDAIVSSMAHGAAVPIAHLNAITAATTTFDEEVLKRGGGVAAFQAELASAAG